MKYLLGALAVGLVVWGVAGQFRTSAARARADDVRAMLDSTQVEMAKAQAERHDAIADRMRADSARVVDSTELAGRLANARYDMIVLEDSSRTLLRRLSRALDSLPDSARATVDNVVRVLASEVEACRAGLELADSLHTLCGERLEARDSTIADLNLTVAEQTSMLHAEIALRETYRGLANPGFLERIRQALPAVGVALAVGIAIGLSIGGP